MPASDRAAVARMPGSSIAAPGAVGWLTDFLNAAFFARPRERRSVEDLRLATGIVTTRWHRRGAHARLGARDVAAFHRAFGRHRAAGRPWLTLDRAALLDGAADLLGDWFPAAAGDPARRAHGIAFETVAERDAFDPAARLAHAALGDLSPPVEPPGRQQWSHYPPVPLPSAAGAAALLLAPHRWPDIASAAGRFTALRRGGLRGQTFEIEIVGVSMPRAPLWTRGYVTATRVLEEDDGGLGAFLGDLETGAGEPAVPDGARVLAAVELTTHVGHFLGRARSRLLVWEDERGGWVRDVGSWDPLPPELAAPYALAGRAAQHAFWGPDDEEASMLVQLARASA